jgi:hypothetical protein
MGPSKQQEATGTAAVISDPIAKVWGIEELAKEQLAKILAKKSVVAEKEASIEEEVTENLLELSRGEGLPNTRTYVAVLAAPEIGDALHPPDGTNREPPKKKSRIAPDITSAHAEGLRIMAPTNSAPVLERLQKKQKQTWMMGCAEGGKPPSDFSLRAKAKHLEEYLATQSRGNGTTVVEILLATLSRGTMKDIYAGLLSKLKEGERTDDAILLDRQRDFIQYHASEGQRTKVIQDAVDAVVTASVWTKEDTVAEDDKKVAIQKVANRLGTNWQKVKSCSGQASLLIRSGEKYSPYQRKKRSDCSREAANVAVQEFCSNIDTESNRSVKVKHKYAGKVETHPFRVWLELTLKDRYTTFLESSAFKKFKGEYPKWNIGKEVFRQLISNYVRDRRTSEGAKQPSSKIRLDQIQKEK